jgi:hypothetical protein
MMYIKGWVRIRGKLHTSNPFFEMERSPKKIDLSPARSLAVREKKSSPARPMAVRETRRRTPPGGQGGDFK